MPRKLGRRSVLMALLLGLFSGGISPGQGAGSSVGWLKEDARIKLDLSGTYQTVDGESVSLRDFNDGVLVLNFWATWCGPCRAEMPSLVSLHKELGRKGLEIVAITEEDNATVSQFLDQNPYPFTVLIDEDESLVQRFRILSIPWTLIVDRNGKLVHFHRGARLWDTPDVMTNLGRLLRE
jgi:thiol-disulfide isomerase/thioredoxin